MNLKDESPKGVVLVLLANNFYTDPRVRQEVESLAKGGFVVHVFCWDREGKADDANINDRIIVKNLKILTSKEFSKVKYAISAIILQIMGFIYGAKLIKKYKKIIVHANDFNTLLGAYLIKLFFQKNVKVVYDSHELTPAVYEEWYGKCIGKLAKVIEKFLIGCADVVLTVSEPIASYLKTITHSPVYIFYNYPSEKLIPKVDKMKAREILGLPRDKLLIMYVGGLRYDVALFELIESGLILKKKGLNKKINIVIVGGGQLEEKIKNFVKENNLEDTILLIPRVSRDKALLYLSSADVSYVIYKSLGYNTYIGMPWKLFESLACGTKVMIKEGTYMAEFLKTHGYRDCAIILSELSPEKITESLENMINSEIKTKNNNNFTWESQEHKFLKVYEGLK
jgi:glycosyltransferase involved in cell wall biosynthesis